ncbi:hypothetical protein F66182_2201 [Fusarium sp. NRRL 66182]|nr:hypothetical protein F66182_2201 [Fusarium sp. NRRL 66182]
MPTLQSFLFILLILFARLSLAAHVHFKDCSQTTPSHYSFEPDQLKAFLDRQYNGTKLRLMVGGNYPDLTSCHKSNLRNASIELGLAALGGTGRYSGEILNATCQTQNWGAAGFEWHIQSLDVLFRINSPSPLATYELKLNINDPDHLPTACLTGFLTPDIGSTIPSISFWGPLITFGLVIFVALWREWLNLGQPVVDDDESDRQTSPDRSHLTRIADCLTYIQFAFFAAALSLKQPGFLQPVVASVSWSTLMLRRGIIWRDSVYTGVNHGIHEINGTFGGTSGLEHMTQVMGAPVTVESWSNIVIQATVILALLFIILQLGLNLRWTRDWFRQSGSWMLGSSTEEQYKATAWVALRVFLSYLLLPLTAWTTYQFEKTRMLPAHYTILSILVVVFLLVAFWWGMSSRSPHDMGYLVLGDLQMHETNKLSSHAQNYYTFATFALLLARGIAIGGLQSFGMAQLLVLIMCELLQLGFLTWAGSASAMLSRPTLVTGARLCTLLFCVGMVPGLWNHATASALGYVILIFHSLLITSMFLVPTLYDLVQLAGVFWSERRTQPSNREYSPERPQVRAIRIRKSETFALTPHRYTDSASSEDDLLPIPTYPHEALSAMTIAA